MTKRLLSLMLTLIMALSACLPAAPVALAQEGTPPTTLEEKTLGEVMHIEASGDRVTVTWMGQGVSQVALAVETYTYDPAQLEAAMNMKFDLSGDSQSAVQGIAEYHPFGKGTYYAEAKTAEGEGMHTATFTVAGLSAQYPRAGADGAWEKGFRLRAWLTDAGRKPVSAENAETRYTAEIAQLLAMTSQDYEDTGRMVRLSKSLYDGDSFFVYQQGVTLVPVRSGVTLTQPGEKPTLYASTDTHTLTLTDDGKGDFMRPSSAPEGKTGGDYLLTGADDALIAQLSAHNPDDPICIAVHDGRGEVTDFFGLQADAIAVDEASRTITLTANAGKLEERDYLEAASVEGSRQYDNAFSNIKHAPTGSVVSGDMSMTVYARGKFNTVSVYTETIADFRVKEEGAHFVIEPESKDSVQQKGNDVQGTGYIFSLPLFSFFITGVPGFAEFSMGVNLEFLVTSDSYADFYLKGFQGMTIAANILQGVDYDRRGNTLEMNLNDTDLDDVETATILSVFFGVGIGPSFTFANLLSVGMELCAGMQYDMVLNNARYTEDLEKWHACEVNRCLEGRISFVIYGTLYFSVWAFTSSLDLPVTSTSGIGVMYKSITFGDVGDTSCPHWGELLIIDVVQKRTMERIEGAVVEYEPVAEHYEAFARQTTNKQGEVRIYLPEGTGEKRVSATLETVLEDGKTHRFYAERSFVSPRAVRLELDTLPRKVIYENTITGTPGNWPQETIFYRDEMEYTLSDKTPTFGGHEFMGWCLDPKGASRLYLPGSKMDFFEDTTLYAIWKNVDDNYHWIIYDANGGKGAPETQTVQHGETVNLSDVVPTLDGYKFMGWEDVQNPAQLHQPGEAYKAERTLQLRARWMLDAKGIVKISYDVGGAPCSAPPVQTSMESGWLWLTSDVPQWDAQHTFKGWSENPDAFLPSHYPGMRYQFFKDTLLCALWDVQYRFIEGMGGKWHLGAKADKTLRFVADGNSLYFTQLLVDGLALDEKDFTTTDGSTVIELHGDYLNTLKKGKHTIQAVYQDGKTDIAPFYVVHPSDLVPGTGDASSALLWLSLLALSGAALVLMVKRRRK